MYFIQEHRKNFQFLDRPPFPSESSIQLKKKNKVINLCCFFAQEISQCTLGAQTFHSLLQVCQCFRVQSTSIIWYCVIQDWS
uniref:Uncharacterized protein n=1 Tax=Octopus bimaculoides TaxID=37653 RepID=A0A0L8FLE7_OCTBM